MMKVHSRKVIKSVKWALAFMLSLSAIVLASSVGAASRANGNLYTLEVDALRGAHSTELYAVVSPLNELVARPEAFKKVTVKVYDSNGNLQSTNNFKDVAALGGQAAFELGEVPLLSYVEVQVLLQTEQSLNTEVLHSATYVVEFNVAGERVIVPEFVGVGTQYNQNLYAHISAVDGITMDNVKELEHKVIALGSQHVRIFFDSRAFDTNAYPDYMDSFVRTVELAQRSGSTVNITWWHGPYPEPEQQMLDFADVLYDLVHTRNLTAVQYVTVQNEVNTTQVTMELYEQLYRTLDAKLDELGIRDRFLFIGGDLVYNNQESWFQYMAANMNDILDGYSVHIYWTFNFREYGLNRLIDIRAIYDELPEQAQKPLYITEYGVRGLRWQEPADNAQGWKWGPQPGSIDGTPAGTPFAATNINAFQHAWFNMEALNRGFAALVKWDAYKAKFDNGVQYYSAIGSGNDGYPLQPIYYALRLFTSTAQPGWQVVGVDGDSPGKLVTAMTGPDGEMTVYALNDSEAEQSFVISGFPADTALNLLVWNMDGNGGLTDLGAVLTNDGGVARITIPVQSFAALTSTDAEL